MKLESTGRIVDFVKLSQFWAPKIVTFIITKLYKLGLV